MKKSMTQIDPRSCSDCGLLNCHRQDKRYPEFCPTEALDEADRADLVEIYGGDALDGTMARAAADVEGTYYGKVNRIEETIAFARRIGVSRIGIATCIGLIEETRTLVRILKLAGFETTAALCKVGSIDKTEIGLPEEKKVRCGSHEAACNPIFQARLLNKAETGFNLVMGLCVGHDALFIRHSEAPVSVLVVKDRLLGHNPVAGLYTTQFYNARLLDPAHLKTL